MLDDSQLGGRDPERRHPAERMHRLRARNEDRHLAAVPGKHLVGVAATRRARPVPCAAMVACSSPRAPRSQAAELSTSTTLVIAAAAVAGTLRSTIAAGAAACSGGVSRSRNELMAD